MGFSARNLIEEKLISCDTCEPSGEQIGIEHLKRAAAQNKLSEILLMALIPSGLCAPAWAYLNKVIQEEIETGQEQEISKFFFLQEVKLSTARRSLESSQLPPDLLSKCLKAFDGGENAAKDFQVKRKSAIELLKWLRNEDNRLDLRDKVLARAVERYPMCENFESELKDDIANFLIWLRDSFELQGGYKVGRNMLKALDKGMPNSNDTYLYVIQIISEDEDLINISTDSFVLQDFTDELSEKTTEQIQKIVKERALTQNTQKVLTA